MTATIIDRIGAEPRERPTAGLWGQALGRLLRNRLAVAGLALICAFSLVGLLAPLIAPYDPGSQDIAASFEDPSIEHPMGTDILGRDWLSRLIFGARLSIGVGFVAQAIVLGIGLPLGLIAGYASGRLDNLLMRFTDLFYAFPDLLLIILLRSVLGGGVFMLILIIGFVGWVDMARLARGQALALRQREFVEAARSLGATHRQILFRHLLPNLIGPVIVLVSFGIPRAIFAEAALGFMGVGLDPATPSWGTMVHVGYGAISSYPHLVLFPSLAIALLMLSFTFVGDGLRDALDPKITSRPRGKAEIDLPRGGRRRGQAAPERPAAGERAA